jgi:hypothetical protein
MRQADVNQLSCRCRPKRENARKQLGAVDRGFANDTTATTAESGLQVLLVVFNSTFFLSDIMLRAIDFHT